MKASKLITELQNMQKMYGDVDVIIMEYRNYPTVSETELDVTDVTPVGRVVQDEFVIEKLIIEAN